MECRLRAIAANAVMLLKKAAAKANAELRFTIQPQMAYKSGRLSHFQLKAGSGFASQLLIGQGCLDQDGTPALSSTTKGRVWCNGLAHCASLTFSGEARTERLAEIF